MNCPACNVDLIMSERHGIEIDYCPKCRGVWLDRGELDKIIERSDAAERSSGQSPPARRRDDRDDDYEDFDDDDRRRYHERGQQPVRKRRSFWTELFD